MNRDITKSMMVSLALTFVVGLLLHGCDPNRQERTSAEKYDYLIQGATVIDGTGTPGYLADVAIVDDKIVAVGNLDTALANKVIDATGKFVVPGFIDLHSHSDDQQGDWRGMRSPDPERRAATAMVSQGITTSVANPDGLSPNIPLSEQIAAVESQPFALNLAYMSALARIRYSVLGSDSARPANPDEIVQMRALLEDDMRAGAWGLATALEMKDGHWTTTDELIGFTAALKPFDGVFIAHPRSQSLRPGWWWAPSMQDERGTDYPWAPSMSEASQELIDIAEANDIRVSISHAQMVGPDPHQEVVKTVDAINEARKRGVKIYADTYVERAIQIGIYGGLIPFWAVVDGWPFLSHHISPTNPNSVPDFLTPLKTTLSLPDKVEPLRRDIEHQIAYYGGPNEIYITDHPNAEWIGKTLADLAEQFEVSPIDMSIKIALEGHPEFVGGALAYGNSRSNENIALFVQSDWVAGDTDGYTTRPGDPGYLNPRFYGAYPDWIKTYVVDQQLVSLEFAVRSFTGLAAEVLGISDRGVIKSGLAADLSVIDLANIEQKSTYYDLHQYSTGFDYVFINGIPVVAETELQWVLPGKVLRKKLN